jgi:hypothetical protein
MDAMWTSVARGFVKQEHAAFVEKGLRYGFTAGVDVAKMAGHRWFRNYPSATDPSARVPLHDALSKRLDKHKTLDLGPWSAALGHQLRSTFSDTAIFPMGCVDKAIEFLDGSPDIKAKRPTSDHTRTGLNAATDMTYLSHLVDTYRELEWFLQLGYFMRVSDVDAAFPMLPFAPILWPFTLFRYFPSPSSEALHLYLNVCGDFGTAGMPGTFKIFFVDVVVQMARAFQVLTLPMPVYVDDMGLIGPSRDEVDHEMEGFHAWASAVCGVMFKALKDRWASQRQLMLGLWWDSTTLTRTLEETKLHSYG